MERWARAIAGSRWSVGLPWALGIAIPVAVAAAWIPARNHLSNVNAALLLVAVVALVGLAGQTGPIVIGAVAAALAFDVFDTAPYGTLAISRSSDLVTTVVLALVAAGGGILVGFVQRARRSRRTGSDAFSRVRDAAALVAEGGEPALVLSTVLEEIRRLLGLRDCWYEAEPPVAIREVTRDGQVVSAALLSPGRAHEIPVGTVPPWDHVSLPVWVQGRRVGAFRLVVTPGVPLDAEHLMVAITLADQAGAALAGYELAISEEPSEDPGAITTPALPSAKKTLASHLRLLR